MGDRSVVTFYYDYEPEDEIYGKRRVKGLISKQYRTGWLSDIIPNAYNGLKFFIARCNHWNFDMGTNGRYYDELNAAFDTFFDEENINCGKDLVSDALKRADQNLYGYVPEGELMDYLFGWDIFGSIHITYTGTLKDGYVLKYGFADHGYDFKPLSFRELLEEKHRSRVMEDHPWDAVKPRQFVRSLDKLDKQGTHVETLISYPGTHVETLFSYQGSGGSFDIFINPDKKGKLYVINGTDEKGNEFERSFNLYDFDVNDMDYAEFCTFLLISQGYTEKIYELMTDDFFENAEGFKGIFDRGDRMELLCRFIDKYDGINEELTKIARWCYSFGYDHCKMKSMCEFFEQNSQLIETEKDFFGVSEKGYALVKEKIEEPKRQYETLTEGKTGPICDWVIGYDDTPIDKIYLSVLTYNCLMENDIHTFGGMRTLTFEQMDEMKNIPLRSKVEILEAFYSIDDRDGSVEKNWPSDLIHSYDVDDEYDDDDGVALESASEELRGDKEVILEAVKENGYALQYDSKELLGDKEVVLEAVKQSGCVLQYASKELQGDKEVALEAIKHDVDALEYVSEELQGDKEFVLEAVKQNRLTLEYVIKELLGDKKFMLEVVKQHGCALQYASEELRGDKEIVLEAVKRDGDALKSASEELQGDKEVVLEAVKCKGDALQYASKELQGNKEVVLEAVKRSGRALEFASKELRGDKEVVLEAVKQNGYALQYASEELRGNKEIVLEAVKHSGMALKYASKELRGDKEVVLEAVKEKGYALKFASEELQGDKEFVLEAVKRRGRALEFASEELQGDKEVVLEAIKRSGKVLEYASKELQKDEDVLKSLKNNSGTL